MSRATEANMHADAMNHHNSCSEITRGMSIACARRMDGEHGDGSELLHL